MAFAAVLVAVFVVHVPHEQGGVVFVALGEFCVDDLGAAAEGGGGEAMVVTQAPELPAAVGVDAIGLGVTLREPGGSPAAGSGEDDADAVPPEAIDDLVKPDKIELILSGFE